MSRDKVEGFMFGLGAGFLLAYVLKSPDDVSDSPPGDKVGDVDAGLDDHAKRTPQPSMIAQSRPQIIT